MKHELYMRRCLELARRGMRAAAPNPSVGAVIVHQDRIIGEGHTAAYGGSHAEVNAIASVEEKDIPLLKESRLYVSLEPCAHHGKTPPCADLIIAKQIPHVIIACRDPFDQVDGLGIKKLKEAGCQVEIGVLEKEAQYVHRRFFTNVLDKRPYIILKWAQTANGYFAPLEAEQKWITNKVAKRIVHQWRREEASILVGTQTALTDNPRLTNRLGGGEYQPSRLVIDKQLKLSPNLHLFDNAAPTIIFNELKSAKQGHLSWVQIDSSQDLIPQILTHLYEQKLHSIIVEGGLHTLQTFIAGDYWDEARILIGGTQWETGKQAPIINGMIFSDEIIQKDELRLKVIHLKDFFVS